MCHRFGASRGVQDGRIQCRVNIVQLLNVGRVTDLRVTLSIRRSNNLGAPVG
ncbi:MAG: hypothetical protein H6655_08610 [Ardenticatenaceae bacterium]|nr:hypothetical protein [Ardenticatenaceae bacterium]